MFLSQKEKDHEEDLDVGWKDNIRIHHREIGWGGMDRIDLAKHRNQGRAHVNTLCIP
jgi:hypothetical protein